MATRSERTLLLRNFTHDKIAQSLAFGTLVISSILWFSFSWYSGLGVCAAYFLGVLFCFLFRDKISWLSSFFFASSSSSGSSPAATQNVQVQCGVCGGQKCDRHQQVVSSFQTFLPEPLNAALEELFETILEMYIERWHSRVSEDTGFEQQLRMSIHRAVSNLLHRASKLDESQIIMDRLLPAAVVHIDTLLRKSGTQIEELQTRSISFNKENIPSKWNIGSEPYKTLPIEWHSATFSRCHELSYLRQLTKRLLPYVLPQSQLKCKAWEGLVREILARWVLLPAMDLLADGAVVMQLLVHLLEYSSMHSSEADTPKLVPTLKQFVTNDTTTRTSRLQVGLSNILHDAEPKLLYYFMQFLKKEGAIHVLQFCLDLEKFNDRMLDPDLNLSERKELFQEAWDIFSLYFLQSSPDCVGFPLEIVIGLKTVLEGGEGNVLRLRNTPPLFQAYEWAFSKLEQEYLPQFHHSEDYFQLLCGGRLSNCNNNRSPRHKTDETLSSWNDGSSSAAYAEIKDDWRVTLEESGSGVLPAHRNLNAWRVSVPRVYLRPESAGSSRITAVMKILVQRIDINEDDDPEDCRWLVYRTYADFCALASKLQEFHGEFEEAFGAPLKRPLTSGLEALETWRIEGEEYLQLLLQTPTLQSSDLLCAFLSADFKDFSDAIGGSELSLSKVLGTVRIRREHGQHLQPFVSNLLASSRSHHSKPQKSRAKENEAVTDVTFESKLNLNHNLYGNNLGLQNMPFEKCVSSSSKTCPNKNVLQGLFDCVIYLVVRIFGAPSVIVQTAMTIQKLIHNAINASFHHKLQKKLRVAYGSHKLVQLIHMLKDEISGRRNTTRESHDGEQRIAKVLLRLLEDVIPWPVSRLPNNQAALTTLISALRTPILNKQLAYNLLDIVAEELVPEVAKIV